MKFLHLDISVEMTPYGLGAASVQLSEGYILRVTACASKMLLICTENKYSHSKK